MPDHFFTPTSLRDATLHHEPTGRPLLCAAWMEERGVDKLRFVGPFGDLSAFRRGTKVRIPAGTSVRTSCCVSKSKVVKRSYVVTLHDRYIGYFQGEQVVPPCLLWTGSGGVWHYVDPNDVELVSSAS